MTLGRATEAYRATLGGAEQASTRRAYGRVLRRVTAEFGAGMRLASARLLPCEGPPGTSAIWPMTRPPDAVIPV